MTSDTDSGTKPEHKSNVFFAFLPKNKLNRSNSDPRTKSKDKRTRT